MLDYSGLEKDKLIIYKNKPYKIIEIKHLHLGRGSSIKQAKIKCLIDGSVIKTTFRKDDEFGEPEIEKKDLKFIYSHRGKYCFSHKDDPSKRFFLTENQIKTKKWFLIPKNIYKGLFFENNLIDIELPKKIELKVKYAPPGVKGNTIQSPTKEIETETGLTLKVPLFIKEGDVIIVNTETLKYVERKKKN